MNCIFGLFDVLGFKSFCENCDTREAETVFKIMDEFETEIPEILLTVLDIQGTATEEKKEMLKSRLHWLTFSDTIFVALPYDLSGHPDELKFNLLFFSMVVAYINRRMFEIGLPVRGAVHIGDVALSKKCFAGKAVVEAYSVANRIQMAATVISEKASEFLLKPFTTPGGFRFMLSNMIAEVEVSVGTKLVSEHIEIDAAEKMKTLCWAYLELGRERFTMPDDIRSFVISKFTAHSKKLETDRELLKVRNTEKLFYDWRAANHASYKREVVNITGNPK
jgi:hypothetical protein